MGQASVSLVTSLSNIPLCEQSSHGGTGLKTQMGIYPCGKVRGQSRNQNIVTVAPNQKQAKEPPRAHVHACTHTLIYILIQTYKHKRTLILIHSYAHTFSNTCTHILHTHTHILKHTHTHMYAHIFKHTHTHMHAHIFKHTHTHIHTCMHTYTMHHSLLSQNLTNNGALCSH